MALPRSLWLRSPLALLRHPAVLAGVAAASFLASVAAASAPLLRAGAESEALKRTLADLTPLGAGLTVETGRNPVAGDDARRAAARRLARTFPHVGAPVLTVSTDALLGGKVLEGGRPLEIVPMARAGATAHVRRLAGGGDGAWIAQRDAEIARVAPGGRIELVGGPSLRVGAVYRQLDEDLDNPYWVNFIARIRSPSPDPPPRPSFLLVGRHELYRIARATANGLVEDTFEYPVDVRSMTPARAKRLAARFSGVRGAQALGCPCHVTSPISSAVSLAALSVDALTPVVSLLAGLALAIALGAAVVAGVFGVRRRAAEARLSVVNGELRSAFALRGAVESLLPGVAGSAGGFACASLLVRLFTPSGTVDRSVAVRALAAALTAGLAAVLAVSAGAFAARGPLLDRRPGRRRALPWELPALLGAALLFVLVDRGGGLTKNAAVGSHPRLVVLCLPLLLAAGVAGLAARLGRPILRVARPRGDIVFLATRRLLAARSLVVLLGVTAATAIAALAFAETLDRTLSASAREKAYVANGSDVQAVIGPFGQVPRPLPFPAALVTEDFQSSRVVGSETGLELITVRPRELARVVDQPALAVLAADAAPLPAIAGESARGARAIWFNGRRVPVHVVAVVRSFPGMAAGQDLLVVPAARLERAVRQPYQSATAYVWVRGDRHAIERALARASPASSYVTTVHEFLRSADLSTASRTYGFLRVIALGAATVALVALLLYLYARARNQLVTAEVLERMGMSRLRQAGAAALEAALLVLFASVVGIGSALLAARALAARLDPLPQYAPAVVLDVPWSLVAATLLTLVAVSAAVAALAAALARGDLGEAVRAA